MDSSKRAIASRWMMAFLVAAILFGVFFRLNNIGLKVFWFDEAITAHVISGYTNEELGTTIAGIPIPSRNFASYYGVMRGRGLDQALHVSMVEDLHPPIYYALAWAWAKIWQSQSHDLAYVLRSLSSIIGIACIPLMYWMCLELFGSSKTAAVAAALYALSPFQVLYAQEARMYTLWTAAILVSSSLLLRAQRRQGRADWLAYSLSLAASFYIHLFSLLLAAGHISYVVASAKGRRNHIIPALFASLLACVALMPWIAHLINNPWLVGSVNSWTSKSVPLLMWLSGWGSGIMSLVLDLNISYPRVGGIGIGICVIAFEALCVMAFFRAAPTRTRLFVAAVMAANALPLLLPDLLFGGQRSSNTRYLLPFHLMVQAALAYTLSEGLLFRSPGFKKWGDAVIISVLAIGACSCIISAGSAEWWNKYGSDELLRMSQVVNSEGHPLIISNGQMGYLYCLTRLVKNDTMVLVIGDRIPVILRGYDAFLLSPSDKFRARFSQEYVILPVDGCPQLWRMKPK